MANPTPAPDLTPASSTFDLRIEFAGLCLYVRDEGNADRTVVVMPDARGAPGAAPTHLDGCAAEPHVGYLRLDLRNVAPKIANVPQSNIPNDPRYEVVHRFARERVELSLPNADAGTNGTPQVPAFDGFAPILEPDPAVFVAPYPRVGMLMELIGGTFTTPNVDPVDWTFAAGLHPAGTPYSGRFGGEIRWSRTLPGSGLTARIRSLDDPSRVTEIPLTAVPDADGGPGVVRLKLANLCKINPLEWSELPSRSAAAPDVDFKWLYQLLRVRPGATPHDAQWLFRTMPIPEPVLSPTVNQGSLQNCFGGQTSRRF
jgi:hypothetical protein